MTADASMASLRAFIYVQHLSGVGHTVRMQRLGTELSRHFEVSVLDGGRPLPFPDVLDTVPVPRLARIDRELRSLAAGLALDETLSMRAEAIGAWLNANTPDLVIVEHYPFSKWELEQEILPMLRQVRALNPDAKVVASLRDISPPTRYEQVDGYADLVLERLHKHFDALLVHADPSLCALTSSFPRASDIRLPVHHTGIVAPSPLEACETMSGAPYVVASVGGGLDRSGLAQRVEEAWMTICRDGEFRDARLLLFGGLDQSEEQGEGQCEQGAAETPGIQRFDYSEDFRSYLEGAAASISCAGYNTCADLLSCRTPALLLPNTAMSDQLARAHLLDARGVATLVPEPAEGCDALAGLLLKALRSPPEKRLSDIDLNGAARSTAILKAMMEQTRRQA
ncbi:MAG: glycosyltransferase [Pseudomonadota bacterium]